MVWPLYALFIWLMLTGIRISAIWNSKSRLWLNGRQHWKASISRLPEKTYSRIWFHVSSLGEFEQARPVMEDLKKKDPQLELVLTFFSPSGYEIRKHYEYASVYYLPLDLPGNASYWMDVVKPDLAVFVKYDLWPGYLSALNKRNIPYLLISAHFRLHRFASWSIPPTRGLLKKAKAIFLQDQGQTEMVSQYGFTNLKIAGDTRIDRTLTIAQSAEQFLPETLKNVGPFDLVAGSTWPPDEKLLIPVVRSLGLKWLIAPHNIGEANLQRLMHDLGPEAVRYTQYEPSTKPVKIMVLDTIGMLAFSYAQGKIAYIGGGFGKGIHNILEPAAHHLPVVFGPKYDRFPEAQSLISTEGAFSITTAKELEEKIAILLTDKGKDAGESAYRLLEKNQGATQIIAAYIRESIPFGPQ